MRSARKRRTSIILNKAPDVVVILCVGFPGFTNFSTLRARQNCDYGKYRFNPFGSNTIPGKNRARLQAQAAPSRPCAGNFRVFVYCLPSTRNLKTRQYFHLERSFTSSDARLLVTQTYVCFLLICDIGRVSPRMFSRIFPNCLGATCDFAHLVFTVPLLLMKGGHYGKPRLHLKLTRTTLMYYLLTMLFLMVAVGKLTLAFKFNLL